MTPSPNNIAPEPAEFGLLAMTGIAHEFNDRLSYQEGVAMMEEARQRRRDGAISDTILYFEHAPVITYGRSTPAEDMPTDECETPLIEVARGGLATWHGPGQLIGYPVIDLTQRTSGASPDIHQYLRAIEEGLRAYLENNFGLTAFIRPGHTGVWVGNEAAPRKIASIGISARRWISGHGFALNIHPDLRAFRSFKPCGLNPAVMTSLERELRRSRRGVRRLPTLSQAARTVHVYLTEALRAADFSPKPTETPEP